LRDDEYAALVVSFDECRRGESRQKAEEERAVDESDHEVARVEHLRVDSCESARAEAVEDGRAEALRDDCATHSAA